MKPGKPCSNPSRNSISFEVHTEGNPKARKRLDDIVRETIGIDAELASLAAAIRTGETRVDEAKRGELREQEAVKAEKAIELLKDLLSAAKIADRSFAQGFAALTAMQGVVSQLNAIGSGPNLSVAECTIMRCLVASSLNSRFPLGALPPNERSSLTDLVGRWSATVEAFAHERLAAPRGRAPSTRDGAGLWLTPISAFPAAGAALGRHKRHGG